MREKMTAARHKEVMRRWLRRTASASDAYYAAWYKAWLKRLSNVYALKETTDAP